MKARLRLALALLGLSAPAPALAIDTSDNLSFDLGVKLAAVQGTVATTTFDTDINQDVVTRTAFGGITVAVGANFDMTRWLSVNGSFHFLLDPTLFQVTRKGLDITVALYMLGGSRRTMLTTDDMTIMERDPFGVAFLLRPSFAGYTLNPNATNKTEASILTLDVGAEYRMELSDRSGVTFALLFSGLSVPASGTRLKAALLTLELGYRVFL